MNEVVAETRATLIMDIFRASPNTLFTPQDIKDILNNKRKLGIPSSTISAEVARLSREGRIARKGKGQYTMEGAKEPTRALTSNFCVNRMLLEVDVALTSLIRAEEVLRRHRKGLEQLALDLSVGGAKA